MTTIFNVLFTVSADDPASDVSVMAFSTREKARAWIDALRAKESENDFGESFCEIIEVTVDEGQP
jgi:hypothetical protein